MNIILIAPPAGGKGTQANLICNEFGLAHISTGDLLRKEVENGNAMLSDIMKKGELVSDDIILNLIKNYISSDACKKGYLLDGFPRNIEQAKSYDKILNELSYDIGYVIVLDVDKEISQKRISGRRCCLNCGATYNIYFENMKPSSEGICDKCGSSLIQREDDNESTYNKRYETYLNQTKPLIDYYREKGVLYIVDASGDAINTFEQIKDIVRGD